ncbi:hypothetical protein I317_04848 [Kwoniella heveanensis CBS 569]|nr:hypothetical protein I317_04848 [Kwoniella heveanensis CBS 569]
MVKNLLDLSDEVLTHIASFTHRDDEIPLPSFGPHWLNLYQDFDQNVAQDYYSLRSTCKKINALCPLRGLHCELESLAQMDKMLTKAPQEALNGIRRMRVLIPRSSAPKVTSIYAKFINLLQTLPNLEELIFVQNPFCFHPVYRTDERTTESLRIVPADFLPKLKSLSFDISCYCCKALLPSLIIPGAPQLKALRVAIGTDPKDPTYGPVKALSALYSAWQKRHKDAPMPISNLFLRIIPSDAGLLNTLQQLSKVFPHLEHLHVSLHSLTDRMDASLAIAAEQLRYGWNLEVEDPVGSGFCQPLCSSSTDLTHPIQGETRAEYLKLSDKADRAIRGLSKHNKSIELAIREVISELMANIPQLCSGAFWEYSKCRNQSSIASWHRWEWKATRSVPGSSIVIKHQHGGENDSLSNAVHVSSPKVFSAKFVRNRSGICIPRPAEPIDDASDVDDDTTDDELDPDTEDDDY